MKNMNKQIVLKNVKQWNITKFRPYQDDDVPWGQVIVQFQGNGNAIYSILTLDVFDALPSMFVFLNPSPRGYTDLISTGEKVIAGAYTTLMTANASPGSRNAQLQAVESACVATGIIDDSLT